MTTTADSLLGAPVFIHVSGFAYLRKKIPHKISREQSFSGLDCTEPKSLERECISGTGKGKQAQSSLAPETLLAGKLFSLVLRCVSGNQLETACGDLSLVFSFPLPSAARNASSCFGSFLFFSFLLVPFSLSTSLVGIVCRRRRRDIFFLSVEGIMDGWEKLAGLARRN